MATEKMTKINSMKRAHQFGFSSLRIRTDNMVNHKLSSSSLLFWCHVLLCFFHYYRGILENINYIYLFSSSDKVDVFKNINFQFSHRVPSHLGSGWYFGFFFDITQSIPKPIDLHFFLHGQILYVFHRVPKMYKLVQNLLCYSRKVPKREALSKCFHIRQIF